MKIYTEGTMTEIKFRKELYRHVKLIPSTMFFLPTLDLTADPSRFNSQFTVGPEGQKD